MNSQADKCQQFLQLHQQKSAFIIPNPWDCGSAKVMQGMGFQALATTSSGLAYTLGKTDGKISLQEKLTHCTALADQTDIPINADFENGFADDPKTVALNVARVVETGVAGCSIEDFSRDSLLIYDFNHAVERVAAAAEVVNSLPIPFQLTARAENLLHGVTDLDDTIARLQAFERAGASVLYAPGVNSVEMLKIITASINSPFNVLAPFIPGANLEELDSAGAKRVSVGGALNWACVNPLLAAGKEMLEHGSFNWVHSMAPGNSVNKLMGVT